MLQFFKDEPLFAFLMVSVICGTIVSLVRGRAKADDSED